MPLVAVALLSLPGCIGVPPLVEVTWHLDDELSIVVRAVTRSNPGLPIELGLRPGEGLPGATSATAVARDGSVSYAQVVPFDGEPVRFRAFVLQEEQGRNGYLNRYLDYEAEIVLDGEALLVSCQTPQPPAWPTLTRVATEAGNVEVAIAESATVHVSGVAPADDPVFDGPGSRTYSNASTKPVVAKAVFPGDVYAPLVSARIEVSDMDEGVSGGLREPKATAPHACTFSI